MALDGISATQALTARPAESVTQQQIAQVDAPRSEAADAFREMLGSIFDGTVRYTEKPGMELSKSDPVQAAKSEILPSPWQSSAGAGSSAAAASGQSGNSTDTVINAQTKALKEGNQTLRQSFDHAIYVTLVSQVIGGVSQTTSTLVRQQ
jgi:hypothetical protein